MKVYSLFSGIGGFDLAFKNKGHEVVGECEIDEYARQIYRKNFGHYPTELDATKIIPSRLPNFDILCAGFPCQSFSIAGKRLGFEDTRGTMFFEIARIIKEKRPKYLLLENVKGLLSHDKGRTFGTMLRTLDELGYDVEWQVLNSKYFVPQNRERVFIIGTLRGCNTRKVFPIRQCEELSGEVQQEQQGKEQGIRCEISCIDSRYGALRNAGETYLIQLGNIDTKGHNSIWGRVYDPKGIAPTLNAVGGGLGAKTGLFMKDERIRKLTPLECERLQGFPDNWTEGVSDTQRYKCIGNAVTVPVIEYIIEEITKN